MNYSIGAGIGAPATAAGTLAMTGGSVFWYVVGGLGLIALSATMKRLVPKEEV